MDPFQPPNVGSPADELHHQESQESLDSKATLQKHKRSNPRWWTTLAVVFASLVVFILVSTVMSIVAVAVVYGGFSREILSNPESFKEVFRSRSGLVLMVFVPQLALIVPSIVAAVLSPVRTDQRLSLVRGQWPVSVWIAAATATPLVGLLSSILVGSFMDESENLKQLSEAFRFHGENGFLIPLALLIGATPAFCEELVFRGYVQTRLTKSLGPAAGIILASFLFAAFHLDLVHIIAVFPIGLYLGWLSWRSGSIFPAMLGHFVNNALSVFLVVLAGEEKPEVLGAPPVLATLAILGLGIFGLSIVVMASFIYGRPSESEKHLA